MTRARQLGWAGALVGAAALVALAPPKDTPSAGEVVQSVTRPTSAPPAVRAARGQGAPEVLPLVPRKPEAREADGRLWQAAGAALPTAVAGPPRAPPAAVAQALAPAAPPLPFRMLGRYADGGKEGVILQGPDGEVLIAHPGETLGDSYRVESVAGNILVLNYLPLQLRQTMDIGIAR